MTITDAPTLHLILADLHNQQRTMSYQTQDPNLLALTAVIIGLQITAATSQLLTLGYSQ